MKRAHCIVEYQDFKKRQVCARSLIFRTTLKYLAIRAAVSSTNSRYGDLQNVLQAMSQNLSKKTSVSLLKNFCINTGQASSINRFTRLNRMQIKKLIETGALIGARHSR